MPSTRGAAGPPLAKPPPPASTASSSSLSSGRQDRNARLSIAQKSATPQSRSSEEMSEPPRRSQRSLPAKTDEAGKDEPDVDEEAVEEEEEVTRCICGQQDYPGPALSEAFNTGDPPPEDAGGLFISCDGCSVWQHGGCVGIFEESQVPDKYYCEECKPKLHELHTDSRGYVGFCSSPSHCYVHGTLVDSFFESALESDTSHDVLSLHCNELSRTCEREPFSSLTAHRLTNMPVQQCRVITRHLPEQQLTPQKIGRITPSTSPSTRSPVASLQSASMAKRRSRIKSLQQCERAQTQLLGGDGRQ